MPCRPRKDCCATSETARGATFKSDVGAYSYPAPGQPRPHGVSSISGGVVNTTFAYDAKGNMTSGNGLTVTYTASNKAKTITRGTASIAFDHDPEHQRYAQTSLAGVTFYIAGAGVLAERFAGSGGTVRWTNYLMVGGRYVGIHVENADETTLTRYFHTDHLGSIAVITNEVGAVVERLSYDAWGLRRHPDGTPDPSGAIASSSSRGFTGHEHLEAVGLIHMNGRVYDPLLARFGTPDPVTEDPFSSQGWNRYSYVGNSPLNFTDPSGYCFLGCFWKPAFKAVGKFFKENFGAILQIAATAMCFGNPVCAGVVAFAVTGITSGDLGLALRAGMTAFLTASAMTAVGGAYPSGSFGNIAGHALVGCASAVLGSGRGCGPGALSAGITAAIGPAVNTRGFSVGSLVANAVIGGVASAAAGGNFANGAITAAFGYLFNWNQHEGLDRLKADGSMAEIDQIYEALDRLCLNSETACRLIDAIRNGPEDVIIRMRRGTDWTPYDVNAYDSNRNTVHYNPNHPQLKNFWGAPPEIALAHELIHAFYDVNGGLPRGGSRWAEEWHTVGEPTWGDWFRSRNVTGYATFTENKIRKDYGVPLRSGGY